MEDDRRSRSTGVASAGLIAGPTAGLIAAAAHVLAPRSWTLPQNPAGLGLGPYQSTPTLTVVAAVAAVGAVVSIRFRAAGFGLLAVASVWSMTLAMIEFEPVVWLLPVGLVLATGLAARPMLSSGGLRPMLVAGAIAAVGAGLGLFLAAVGFEQRYGPTHPESAAPEPDRPAAWLWVGAVETDSATVVAGGLDPGPHRLAHWTYGAASGSTVVTAEADRDGLARFDLTDLTPDTVHHYRVVDGPDGEASPAERNPDASFRTRAVGPHDVTIVVGSCARTGSNGAVFDTIVAEDPDLYLAIGDLHYGNLVSGDPSDHIEVLGRSLSTPAQSALFSSTPTAWVWDDHDFGDNDSDSSSPSRDAVSVAYRRAVPHYGVDPDPAAPIAQAFTIGRVRVVVADTRSMRTDDSMLGPEQEAWLIDQLVGGSQTHAVVVWANPAPWIMPPGRPGDQWGAYPQERARIANALSDAGVDNLVMVSGDFHLTAIDDGTNTGYADGGGPGFPLLQAGPLDRPSYGAGGPYTQGPFTEPGQFGVVEVTDDGGPTVGVRLSGRSWDGSTVGSLELEFEVRPTTGS